MGFTKIIELKLALARYNNEKLEEKMATMLSEEVKMVKAWKISKARCEELVKKNEEIVASEKAWIAYGEISARERDGVKDELIALKERYTAVVEDNEKLMRKTRDTLCERNEALSMNADQIRKRIEVQTELSDVYTLALRD